MASPIKFVWSWKKAVTVLGAAIVFLTYVYKDVRTEKAKDALSSLKMADLRYEQIVDHDEEMKAIRTQAPSSFKKESTGNKKLDKFYEDSWEGAPITAWEAWQWLIDYKTKAYDRELDAGDMLWIEMKDNGKLRDARKVAEGQQDALKKLVARVPNSFSHIEGRPTPASKEQLDLLLQIPEAKDAADKSTHEYLEKVVEAASCAYAERQKNLDSLSHWTFALFVLGWIIGLIGKFIEPDEKSSEELMGG